MKHLDIRCGPKAANLLYKQAGTHEQNNFMTPPSYTLNESVFKSGVTFRRQAQTQNPKHEPLRSQLRQ